mgnify:CR=1 FL=1
MLAYWNIYNRSIRKETFFIIVMWTYYTAVIIRYLTTVFMNKYLISKCSYWKKLKWGFLMWNNNTLEVNLFDRVDWWVWFDKGCIGRATCNGSYYQACIAGETCKNKVKQIIYIPHALECWKIMPYEINYFFNLQCSKSLV